MENFLTLGCFMSYFTRYNLLCILDLKVDVHAVTRQASGGIDSNASMKSISSQDTGMTLKLITYFLICLFLAIISLVTILVIQSIYNLNIITSILKAGTSINKIVHIN